MLPSCSICGGAGSSHCDLVDEHDNACGEWAHAFCRARKAIDESNVKERKDFSRSTAFRAPIRTGAGISGPSPKALSGAARRHRIEHPAVLKRTGSPVHPLRVQAVYPGKFIPFPLSGVRSYHHPDLLFTHPQGVKAGQGSGRALGGVGRKNHYW